MSNDRKTRECYTVASYAAYSGGSPGIAPMDFTKIAVANVARLHSKYLVTVGVWLERPFNFDANVVGMLLWEHSQFSTKGTQVQFSDLFIEMLREQVNIVFVALVVFPVVQQIQLAQYLIRERARHHEGWVTSGAAKVTQPTRCKDDDAVAIREKETIHLGLDVLHLDARELFKLLHLNLVVEVADVANDSIVFHLLHVLQDDDLEVACRCDKDIHFRDDAFHLHQLEALHACLQRTDRVALRDQHASTRATHREGAAFPHVAIATNQTAFATDHHVRGAHDAVWQRVAATINVIKLRLRNAVVYVDGREEELALRSHLLQAVHARSRFLADTVAGFRHSCVLRLVCWNGILQELKDALKLGVGGTVRVWQGAIFRVFLFELLTFVDQQGGIAAIVHKQVAAIGARYRHHLLGAPPVLWESLALPCEHRSCTSFGNGCSGVVLSAEDVARAPTHL